MTRSVSQSSAEHSIAYKSSRAGKIAYVDLVRADEGTRIERIPAEPDLRIIDPEDPEGNDLRLGGVGYLRESVRVVLSPRGFAASIEPAPEGWLGVLKEVTPTSLTLTGFRSRSRGLREGFFEIWNPEHYLDAANYPPGFSPKSLRVPLSSAASLSVNRDAVSRERLKLELGRVVEIAADCEGRARYVDVYKISEFFNQTGGDIPVSSEPDGTLALEEVRAASDSQPGRRRRLRARRDVKIYNAMGVRISEIGMFSGFVGAWVEPGSGLATHLFLSNDTE